jgi:digeranylgeranylglycerophospholipid reductase
VDAGGYRSVISKRAGIHAGFRRFGVGAEYDLYAPAYDQEEAVAIVGSRIAPGGYAWAAPWGNYRVRLGVGVIHADSKANPADYLDKLVREASTFGMNLNGAEPVEYHYGLIPSDGLAKRFVGNGIMAVGDAAGQASTLLGEGIRWAIMAGRSAGRVAADALAANDYSAGFLGRYEKQWRARHGANLRLAHIFNRRIARWEDDTWDEAVELIKLLTPEQFAQALATNFVAPWVVSALARHPRLAFKGSALVMSQLAADSRRRSRN